MNAKTISVAKLKKLRACPDQIKKFRAIFGEAEIVPTRELCLVHASVFDWNWASRQLLSPGARKAYDEAIAPAEKAYDEAIAPARFDAWKSDQKA